MRIVPADKVRPVVTGRHIGPRTAPLVWKEKTTEWKGREATLTPNSMSQVGKKKRIVKLAYDDDDEKLMGDAELSKQQHTDLGLSCELKSKREEDGNSSTTEGGDSLGAGAREEKDVEMAANKPESANKRKLRKRGTSEWLLKKLKRRS